jgi:hypothetical protein
MKPLTPLAVSTTNPPAVSNTPAIRKMFFGVVGSFSIAHVITLTTHMPRLRSSIPWSFSIISKD